MSGVPIVDMDSGSLPSIEIATNPGLEEANMGQPASKPLPECMGYFTKCSPGNTKTRRTGQRYHLQHPSLY
ncbi:MAG TPA: hypothetical protein VFQ36_18040, partial [Ktedonobacteraceae bacterium]|nr:hypothetical protein [Ktedonobacteraceae bacterium]